MKTFYLRIIYSALVLSAIGFSVSCSSDDSESPQPVQCTFQSDADCFCDDAANASTEPCVSYLLNQACSDFAKDVMFIRWRNSNDAGIFTWEQMTPVSGSTSVYEITQSASNFYLSGGTSPNFGAQILEFSNQADYGGLNNGQPWQLYRNDRTDGGWLFSDPVNGLTSKTANHISVRTTDASGEQTLICPAPDDVADPAGFRLNFSNTSGNLIFNEFSTLKYTIDANTGEVAIEITEGDACSSYDKSESYIRWRNDADAGIFTWEKMSETSQSGIFEISQLAERFYTPDGTEANFGAQILEFSNQPGYGQDFQNGMPVSLFRNDKTNDGWIFDPLVNGSTSKTAQFVEVISIDASGNETVLCAAPDGVNKGGFRLNDLPIQVTRNSKLNYVINANTGEVALTITEEDPCTTYDKSRQYIRWRNSSDAGVFVWEEMTPVDGEPGVFSISQPASNFYLAGATTPNFGSQVIEFSNQSGYGQDLNDGRRYTQLRADSSDREVTITGGVGTKDIVNRKTATRNSAGEATDICEITTTGTVRLTFDPQGDGNLVISNTNTIEYRIDVINMTLAIFIN